MNFINGLNSYIFFTECGLAPTVKLNCTDGLAHVDWAPSEPHCHFNCEAHWTCENIAVTTHLHTDQVTSWLITI